MSDMTPLKEKVRVVSWRMSNEKLRFSEEFRIIPAWAYVLSAVLVIALEVLAPFMRRHDAHPIPLPGLIAIMVLLGILVGALGLLIGYVNRDAKRRGMNATLWTILVIVIPNLIGYIIYFLAREPKLYPCPQCGGTVSARFNFCPKCKFNLHPTCPECKHEIRQGDRFCPYCAHDLSGESSAAGSPLNPLTPGATA